MPLVRIETVRGKSPAWKKTVLDCVHESLAEALGIEDWDRFQRIVEIDREDFETAPGKTEDFLYIELTLFPGRSRAQKGRAIETIAAKLGAALDIAPSDVFIVIHEPPLENWGPGGVQRG